MAAELLPHHSRLPGWRTAQPLWAAVLVVGCIALSTVFACATPFAALATLAAMTSTRRYALLMVLAAWLANQAIGYGLLDYPWTWDSFAWGVAIGGSACLAVLVARVTVARGSAMRAASLSFIAAFGMYELALYMSSFVIPGGEYGFTASVVGYVFLVNAGAAALLVLSYTLLSAVGRAIAAPSTAARSA